MIVIFLSALAVVALVVAAVLYFGSLADQMFHQTELADEEQHAMAGRLPDDLQ